MGHGNPICLEPDYYQFSSIGVDCHSSCSAFFPSQMMLALQSAKGGRHASFDLQGKWSTSVGPSIEQVINLGTILGARAIGLENEIGSLVPGKKADLVIFDASTPTMAVVSQRNPVAAIVLHSSIRDVSIIIVDGIIRKDHGVLCSVEEFDFGGSNTFTGRKMEWRDVALQLWKRADEIDVRKQRACDENAAMKGIMQAFDLDRLTMVDDSR